MLLQCEKEKDEEVEDDDDEVETEDKEEEGEVCMNRFLEKPIQIAACDELFPQQIE